MNTIVIINGSGGSGKDTFVYFCKNNLKEKQIKTFNLSTIDLIKEMCTKYIGWDGDKSEKSRKLLSDMKMICKEYNNSPFVNVTNTICRICENCEDTRKVFFVHTREPDEIQEFMQFFKTCENIKHVVTLLIKRDGCEITSNDSDRRVSEFDYDHIIENNENLKEFAYKSVVFTNSVLVN